MTLPRSAPDLNFAHLCRLTDKHGLFEHALHTEPRPEHGYCLDDVARALVVVCRVRNPNHQMQLLGRQYLAFTMSSIGPTGACHNRMGADGRWTDAPEVGDWWGRALWGLGYAVAHAPTPAMRAHALLGFRAAGRLRSPHVWAMTFAALGAAEVLLSRPGELSARQLLRDCVAAIPANAPDSAWPWPESRLRYSNGSVVEALLVAGQALPDPAAQARGLRLLEFLVDTETRAGQLSVTPVGGRGPKDRAPGFDQQPIEVSALADACARAYGLTGDERWRDAVRMCWAWFLGDNDSSTPMYDSATGGGFDGLERQGHNLNQGAESTLAALSTGQHAQRLRLF